MAFFARNVLLIHVAALVFAFSWIHGGTRADWLLPVVPWLTFFVVEWLLVFPQAKTTETLAEARRRVWAALLRDPLTYAALVLCLLLVIPLFNVAKPPAFDAALHRWTDFKPTVSWLPFCVAPREHAVLLLWFPPVLVSALAVRHGLLKKSKRLLLETICWNAAALSLLGFVQIYSEAKSLLWLTPMESYFFSTFGYPNFAGAFFTLAMGLSLGLWFHDATENMRFAFFSPSSLPEEKPWATVHAMAVPSVLCFLGALGSLSRAAILLSGVVVAVYVLYVLVYIWKRVSSATRIMFLSSTCALVVVTAALFAIFKFEPLKKEARNISFKAVVERVSISGLYHKRVALSVFHAYPLFGVGGWGYPHYQMQFLSPKELTDMQVVGGANVHNDALQFLAEQGSIGFGLVLLCAGLLVFPVLRQACRVARARVETGDKSVKDAGWLYLVPIPLIGVALGTGTTVCHSLGDLPFRDPIILLVWALAWACVPGWLPAIKKS